jgi:hypothetical protein
VRSAPGDLSQLRELRSQIAGLATQVEGLKLCASSLRQEKKQLAQKVADMEQCLQQQPLGRLDRIEARVGNRERDCAMVKRFQTQEARRLATKQRALDAKEKLLVAKALQLRQQSIDLDYSFLQLDSAVQVHGPGGSDKSSDEGEQWGASGKKRYVSEANINDWMHHEVTRLVSGAAHDKTVRYPGELIWLVQTMLLRDGTQPSQVPSLLRDFLATFAPCFSCEQQSSLANIRLPDPTTVRDYRLGLGWLAALQAAVYLAQALAVTLHTGQE